MAEQILKNRLTRVAIKNFRSIAECDVALEPLTILVGPKVKKFREKFLGK